ncbi:MAG: hypothetical protein IPP26_00155 [Flavobacteriales bacterium]|nr:hypothetical protein [Flavobacteriales bacterium]
MGRAAADTFVILVQDILVRVSTVIVSLNIGTLFAWHPKTIAMTTTQELDLLLSTIDSESSNGSQLTWSQIAAAYPGERKGDLRRMLDHLVLLGYVHYWPVDPTVVGRKHDEHWYSSIEGRLVREQGGLVALKRRKIRANVWAWVKLIAVVCNGAALLYLTWRSIQS